MSSEEYALKVKCSERKDAMKYKYQCILFYFYVIVKCQNND